MPFEVPVQDDAPASDGSHKPRRLSQLLLDIAGDETRDRISVADLLFFMKDRAIGALMLIFALPNALPAIPGTSAVLGAPLVFLAAQLALGWRPWLPKVIADRSMTRRDFATLVERAVPWLARAEKLLRPRLSVLAHPPMEYVIGTVCLLLSIILILPIPLGNMLPALAICFLALGILERDGVWIILGMVTAIGAVALVWGVFYALIKSAIFLVTRTVM